MPDSTESALEVAKEIEERALKDPLAFLDEGAIAAFAWLKSKSPRHYEKYRMMVRDETPLDVRTWVSSVVSAQKEIKRSELKEKRRERRKRQERAGELAGVPRLEIGSHAELAGHLFSRLDTEDAPLAFDYQELHRYEPDCGLWEVLTDSAVSSALQSWDGATIFDPDEPEKTRTLQVNNVTTPISMLKHRVDDGPRGTGFFDDAPRSVAFTDGVLLVEGGAIVAADHAPEHRARVGLPFPYVPDQPTPIFERYLESTFYFDDDAIEKIALLQEFAGAALFGMACDFGRAMMLHDTGGRGGTGKSQFLTVLEAMFPDTAVSSIPPQQLSDEYAGAELLGKRLNVVYETPEDDFLAEAGVKAIIHGEPVTRRKIRKDPIRFKPEAAHIFASNALPSAPGTTGAFWDRWLVVEFNRRFRGTDEAEADIGARIASEELAGVVAWAVDGAERLLAQGGYTLPDSCDEALKQWQREARPVQVFLEECCREIGDVDGDSWTQATTVYEEYQDWAKASGFGRLNKTNFGKRLKQLGVDKRHKRDGNYYRLRLLDGYERSRGSNENVPF